jgi:predicted NodU family carbamoyl transferase
MAKIDVSKIAGYSEMSAEEKLAALEAYEYEDNASELDRLRGAASKANSEAAEWKRKHNALLTEDEQRKAAEEAEREELARKYEELLKRTTISDYKARFLAMGYDEKLAADTAQAMAEGNTEKVFANGEKFRADLEKRIKAELVKDTPRPGADNSAGNTSITKEQFAAMGYSERAKLFAENNELYNELINGGI